MAGSEEKIKQGLEWLGLNADESPWHGGEFGPYRQSERLSQYQEHADELIKTDHAYYCFCTSERLGTMRADQSAKHLPPRYDRLCRSILEDQASARAKTEAHVIRMKVPDGQKISWRDLVKGDVEFQSNEIDDQVLIKSDGFPTYHLANVVDDHLMKISHVLRGEDWLSSTPKHLILYQAFGWKPPLFGHFPLILGPDKAKLSKRNGNTSLLYYKQELGVHPIAMTHFMATLGWTPQEVREQYALDQLTADFTLERVGDSPAIFDLGRLNAFSHQYYLTDSEEAYYADFVGWLEFLSDEAEGISQSVKMDEAFGRAMVALAQTRTDNFQQATEFISQFLMLDLKSPTPADLTLDGKIDADLAKTALQTVKQGLEGFNQPLPDSAVKRVEVLQEYFRAKQPTELSGQVYLHPTRVAMTGARQSMNMFEYLSVYLLKKDGKTEIIKRLDRAISIIS